MEVALIVIVAILVVCLAIVVVRKRPEDVGALKSKVDDIASVQNNLSQSLTRFEVALKGVETKVVESTGLVKESVLRDFSGVRETLTKITSELEVHKKLEEDIGKSSRNIERVLVSSGGKGQAGENILEEALRNFPPEMVRANFNVKGGQVEYALVLADKNYVPIDSKWTTPELIQRLDSENDEAKRKEIVKGIKNALSSKVKDITKYIDPSASVRLGIAAVPDRVFDICGDARLDAYRDHQVIVMPYSLTIIYLLSLYQLNLQYYRSLGVEKRLEGYLNQLERDVEKLDKGLNTVSRGATMVENALHECKDIIGDMNRATAYLKTPPAGSEAVQLEHGEQSEAEKNADSGV